MDFIQNERTCADFPILKIRWLGILCQVLCLEDFKFHSVAGRNMPSEIQSDTPHCEARIDFAGDAMQKFSIRMSIEVGINPERPLKSETLCPVEQGDRKRGIRLIRWKRLLHDKPGEFRFHAAAKLGEGQTPVILS